MLMKARISTIIFFMYFHLCRPNGNEREEPVRGI